ncbi:MAG: hypothetical protein IIB89_11550 [Chloroflexi bacterium]|nr:hypothetical protein [Chloroflexota bacterium]
MRWMLEVAYIGVITSWKWLLGSTAVIAVLVGTLFAVGVLGGGEEGATGATPQAASPTPTPAAGPDPGLTPQVLSPTPTPQPTVVPAAKFISIPILATRAKNVGSLEFVLVYDPAKLEFAQLERGLLAGDALIDSSSPGPGRLWAGIIDINGMDGSGPVAIVKFKVRDNAGGTMLLTLENIAAFDANTLVDILTTTTPGEFSGAGATPLSPIVTFQ